MDMCTLLYSKLLTDKDLLNSIWSSAQCDVAARMGGGGLGKNGCTYIHGWVPSRFTWNYRSIFD